MRIPRDVLERYSKALNVLDAVGRARLKEALEAIDFGRSVAEVREDVVRVMQTYCGASSTAAARLAAEFYDGLRDDFRLDDGFSALVDVDSDNRATEGAVRAFAEELVDGRVDAFVSRCLDRQSYESRRAANTCVRRNVQRDPSRPRYARVPTGAETCEFCIMLASRGFVYYTEDLASHSHANCDCRVVPSWDKSPEVEGYDPDYYLDAYNNPDAHPEIAEARNARRRELYAQRKDETSRPE